ncbi:Y-family DNA polymerase [Polymorphobacter sp.]|uniref:Y-family DNA polymerase n=1 Tax=Polymorphobacter sp. TaxID=1909290 RepID=UPI003F6FC3AE
MTDNFVKRRYLALVFPSLSADRWLRQQAKRAGAAAEGPLVFTQKAGNRVTLAAVDDAALRLGLLPGLSLADARARVPVLAEQPHDAAADRHWLDQLAAGCLRYTPSLSCDPPDALLLDIFGVTPLFGDEAGLAEAISAWLARLGMSHRHAFADDPDAALALARIHGRPVADEAAAVRRLPVAVLRLPPESELALRRAGLKTVGEVATRPMAAIAARFGAAAVTAVRRMMGEAPSPRAPLVEPRRVEAERRFAEPVARTDYMLGELARLCAKVASQLEQSGSGGRRFEARLFRTDGLVQPLIVETSRPSRDPALLMRLFDERIEALADPLDPGFGYDLLRLSVPVIEPLDTVQQPLDGRTPESEALAELIDRLSARHGAGRVRRFLAHDSHVPEKAQSTVPALHAAAIEGAWATAPPGEPPLRPLLLFDPPQRIEVLAEVPEGPPRRFRWRRVLHSVALAEGPERIAPEWWRRKDGHLAGGLTRDYYRVEDAEGCRFWIFRHGLYGTEKNVPEWYLHGLFA